METSFIDAVRACKEWKIVVCEYNGKRTRYFINHDDSDEILDVYRHPIKASEILYGKWSIEC